MLLRLKLRVGAFMIVIGGALALIGEFLNIWNTTPESAQWYVALGLIVLGTVVLLYGVSTYAQLSESVSLLGIPGIGLLFLGGIVLIVGAVAIDGVILPLSLGLATAIAASINTLGSTAQNATNTVSSGINTATDTITGVFGQHPSDSHIPQAQVPQVNGLHIVNQALTGSHLPTLDVIAHWGQIFLTGAPLSLGCLLFGFALSRSKDKEDKQTGTILVVCAALNLICQFLTFAPFLASISGILLFAALIWLGATVLLPKFTSQVTLRLPPNFKRSITRFVRPAHR